MAEKLGEAVLVLLTDDANYRRGIRDAKKAAESLDKKLAKTGGAFSRRLNKLGGQLRGLGTRMRKVGRSMSLSLTAPLLLIGGGIIKVAGQFEASMKKVEALTGATGDSLDAMREQAKQLGIQTQFSASEAADAMGFLAMAGFDANQILAATPGILQLAAAGELELARAADIASNVLTQFGLDASEIGRVNDILAATASSANTNVEQMAEAMKLVGTTAAQMGIPLETVAGAIGTMGNAGLQGSIAGTSLNRALTNLISPVDTQLAAQERLGVALFDSTGKMRSLVDIVEILVSKNKGLGDSFIDAEGKSRELNDVIADGGEGARFAGELIAAFGTRGGRAIGALVAQGGKLEEQVNAAINSTGVAAQQAEKRMEGFEGAMKEMRSALEGLAIAIAESGILEMVTDLVKTITEFIRGLAETSPGLLKWGFLIGAAAAALGPLLVALGSVASAIGALLSVIGVVAGAIAAFPVAVIIAALVAAGAAFFFFKDEIVSAFGAAIDFIGAGVDMIMGWLDGLLGFLSGAASAIASFVSKIPGFARGGSFEVSNIAKFQHGGAFSVGGGGGIDSQLVQFMATPGERVTITPEGGGTAGSQFNIDARGADLGIERRIERAMGRAIQAARLQTGNDMATAFAGAGV